MAVFRREDASCTSLLPAVWPLRMRVNRSAMGSVMLMRRPSPARLGETGNLTTTGDLADLHPREAELAVHAARAAGDGATVALARRTRITRLRLQLRLRRHALLGRALGAADQLLELGALHRVLFHDPGATLLALDHARLRHRLFGFLLLPEREVECLEQRSAVTVISCRRRDGDVHAPDLIDLVVLDFGENDLLLHAQGVVALAVEGARRHAAEVADAWHRDVDEAVEELVHASPAQRHLGAYGQPGPDLERRDRLARLGDQRLLPGDLGEIGERRIHHLLVGDRLAHAHVYRDLADARYLHDVVDLQIRAQAGNDLLAVVLLEPGRARALVSHAVRRRLRLLAGLRIRLLLGVLARLLLLAGVFAGFFACNRFRHRASL